MVCSLTTRQKIRASRRYTAENRVSASGAGPVERGMTPDEQRIYNIDVHHITYVGCSVTDQNSAN